MEDLPSFFSDDFNNDSLSQWLDFKLSRTTCLVGILKFKLLSQGPGRLSENDSMTQFFACSKFESRWNDHLMMRIDLYLKINESPALFPDPEKYVSKGQPNTRKAGIQPRKRTAGSPENASPWVKRETSTNPPQGWWQLKHFWNFHPETLGK